MNWASRFTQYEGIPSLEHILIKPFLGSILSASNIFLLNMDENYLETEKHELDH